MTESATEKITINLSVVDLGKIDLLVEEGFYSTRTDLIKTAIRNLLNTHESHIGQAVTRRAMAIGIAGFGRKELEAAVAQDQQLEIKVVGMAFIEGNVTPELAQAAIHSIEVKGVLRASDVVKKALGDKIK
ncbi:MAG: CopG family transcriptional regulator [Chloroflexi bacterium]|nr:CopG family transcriptional regulator [Chloroflexota bacterium]